MRPPLRHTMADGQRAERVSSAAGFAVIGCDEIGLPARSFSRMCRRLVQAMTMLETATP